MRKVQWRNNCSNQHLDAKEPRVLKIFSYMLVVVHTIVSLLCVVLRESGQLSSVQRDFFAGDPFDCPDRPLHNPLLGGAEKSSLYAKQSCAAKPSLLGTNSSKQALLLLLLDCSLRIASGMVQIFFYVSIDHQHVRIIFQFWSQPNPWGRERERLTLDGSLSEVFWSPAMETKQTKKKYFVLCGLWWGRLLRSRLARAFCQMDDNTLSEELFAPLIQRSVMSAAVLWILCLGFFFLKKTEEKHQKQCLLILNYWRVISSCKFSGVLRLCICQCHRHCLRVRMTNVRRQGGYDRPSRVPCLLLSS